MATIIGVTALELTKEEQKALCAGVAVGLTYGKTMPEALEIGTRLAASVITVSENVCPRFLPRELGLDVPVTD